MLRSGTWNSKQLIPSLWVQASTGITTRWEEMNPPYLRAMGKPSRWGFGYMWWVWDALTSPGSIYFTPFQSAYEAVGSGGQYITVPPSKDMVIVHKVDIDKDYRANISKSGTLSSTWSLPPPVTAPVPDMEFPHNDYPS